MCKAWPRVFQNSAAWPRVWQFCPQPSIGSLPLPWVRLPQGSETLRPLPLPVVGQPQRERVPGSSCGDIFVYFLTKPPRADMQALEHPCRPAGLWGRVSALTACCQDDQILTCKSGEWTKKRWCIRAVEYYSATKKSGISPLVTAWMELEGIVLNEGSQTEGDKHRVVSLICGI